MPNSPITKRSMRQLVFAYFSAIFIVGILITSAQILVQYTLHREIISRQVYALIAAQGIASDSLQRNSLLLLVPGQDHASIDAQMQQEITTLETNHARYLAQYSNVYPQLSNIGKGKANVYQEVDSAAHSILNIEQDTTLTPKQKIKQEVPFVAKLFFAGNEQINRIEQALSIVDADSNLEIAHIQLIEIILFALTLTTTTIEVVFIVRPAIRNMRKQLQLFSEKLMAGK